MAWRIEVVQPVSQHAHSLVALRQSLAMGTDIDAIGKAAHHQHLRTKHAQLTHETPYQVLPVGRGSTRAHNADHTCLVQVGRALIVEHQRRVRTFCQPLRIVLVAHRQRSDAHRLDSAQFALGKAQGAVYAAKSLHQPIAGIGQQVTNVLAVGHDVTRRAYLLIERKQGGQIQIADVGQRNGTQRFLFFHSSHLFFIKMQKYKLFITRRRKNI